MRIQTGVTSNGNVGFDICDLDGWPLTLIFCMEPALVIGNNSWKFPDDMMMRIVKHVWQRERQTELELLGRG